MKSERAVIAANGQRQDVTLPRSVADFLVACGWKASQVVVEYNGRVLGRQEVAQIMIQDGDRLEIIVPVAGG